jgi:hypothetical protein|tara:strand:+ start:243 stop:422 length:180 start_codon:yes stop_codon:yes gene_type:complete
MNGPAILLVYLIIASIIATIGGLVGRYVFKSKDKNGTAGFIIGFFTSALLIFLISYLSK